MLYVVDNLDLNRFFIFIFVDLTIKVSLGKIFGFVVSGSEVVPKRHTRTRSWDGRDSESKEYTFFVCCKCLRGNVRFTHLSLAVRPESHLTLLLTLLVDSESNGWTLYLYS